MKFKRIAACLLLTATVGTIYSVQTFASDAKHWASVERNYLGAWGTAHTRWDKAHCTKLAIGLNSSIAGGVEASDTEQVSGWGTARSSYWKT